MNSSNWYIKTYYEKNSSVKVNNGLELHNAPSNIYSTKRYEGDFIAEAKFTKFEAISGNANYNSRTWLAIREENGFEISNGVAHAQATLRKNVDGFYFEAGITASTPGYEVSESVKISESDLPITTKIVKTGSQVSISLEKASQQEQTIAQGTIKDVAYQVRLGNFHEPNFQTQNLQTEIDNTFIYCTNGNRPVINSESKSNSCGNLDSNGDSKVTILDFINFKEHYNKPCD